MASITWSVIRLASAGVSWIRYHRYTDNGSRLPCVNTVTNCKMVLYSPDPSAFWLTYLECWPELTFEILRLILTQIFLLVFRPVFVAFVILRIVCSSMLDSSNQRCDAHTGGSASAAHLTVKSIRSALRDEVARMRDTCGSHKVLVLSQTLHNALQYHL